MIMVYTSGRRCRARATGYPNIPIFHVVLFMDMIFPGFGTRQGEESWLWVMTKNNT